MASVLQATGSRAGYDGVSRPVFTYEDALRAYDSGATSKEINDWLSSQQYTDSLRPIDQSGQTWDTVLKGTYDTFQKAGLGQDAYAVHEVKGYQDADAAKFLADYASNEYNNNADAKIEGGDYRSYWWNPKTQKSELDIYRPGTSSSSPDTNSSSSDSSSTSTSESTSAKPQENAFEADSKHSYGLPNKPATTEYVPPQSDSSSSLNSNANLINSYMGDTSTSFATDTSLAREGSSFNSFDANQFIDSYSPEPLKTEDKKSSVFEKILNSTESSATSPTTFSQLISSTI